MLSGRVVCFSLLICGVVGDPWETVTYFMGNDKKVGFQYPTHEYSEACEIDDGSALHSLDYHYEKDYFFYVTSKTDEHNLTTSKLNRRNIDFYYCFKTETILLLSELVEPVQQVAVDWVNDRLYWRDSSTVMSGDLAANNKSQVYNMSDLLEEFPYLPESTKIEKLFVDPYMRMLLVVATDDRQASVIITSDLSGDNLRQHDTELPARHSVEIDVHTKSLYFNNRDTGEIGMYNYDENELSKSDLSITPWSGVNETKQYLMFDVGENHAFQVVDDVVYKVELNASGSGEKIKMIEINTNYFKELKDIKVFKVQAKNGIETCDKDDCSYHGCLFKDASLPSKDEKICDGADSTVLMTGTGRSLSYVDASNGRSVTCREPYFFPHYSVDYHYKKGYFYTLSNIYDGIKNTCRIWRKKIPLNCAEQGELLYEERWRRIYQAIIQLAVDWVSDNIYLMYRNEVVMTDLVARNREVILKVPELRVTFPSLGAVTLETIFIDPYVGMLFMVATDEKSASVVITSDLTGGSLKLYENMIAPKSTLGIDIQSKRLYFNSLETGAIGMCLYESGNLKKSGISITINSANDSKVIGVFKENIITMTNSYDDPNSVYKTKWSAFGDVETKLLYSFDHRIEGIKVFQRQTDGKDSPDISINALSSGKYCKLPDFKYNRYTRYDCPNCNLTAGAAVSEDLIVVSCSPGTQLISGFNTFSNKSFIRCNNGVWEPSVPQCNKLCPPLTSQTLDLECWQGPNPVTCNQPMIPDTIVKYKCKEYYESSFEGQPTGLSCLPSGKWSAELPFCTPKCGQSNLHSAEITPQIRGGNVSEAGNFPWHAGLFHNTSGRWEAKCGGTLISPRVVLTAAHCVTQDALTYKSPVMDPKNVAIALGKLKRHWYSCEKTQIRRRVKTIYVHPNYAGSPQNYGQDIAVLILSKNVPVNRFIMPACVDYKEKYVSQLMSGTAGYVAGWGNTEECISEESVCNTPSNDLKYGQTSIIDFAACYNATQSMKGFLSSRLTPDKYCAGDGSETVVQEGDSGGGLTFVFDGLHYVYGVVSVKLTLELNKKTYYNFGAFTSVPSYLYWISSRSY